MCNTASIPRVAAKFRDPAAVSFRSFVALSPNIPNIPTTPPSWIGDSLAISTQIGKVGPWTASEPDLVLQVIIHRMRKAGIKEAAFTRCSARTHRTCCRTTFRFPPCWHAWTMPIRTSRHESTDTRPLDLCAGPNARLVKRPPAGGTRAPRVETKNGVCSQRSWPLALTSGNW
jgi:hypothetical protein